MLAYNRIAKKLLAIDGYHHPMAFVSTDNGIPHPFQFHMEDRAEKHLLFIELAKMVEQLSAISVIVIGEMWVASFDPSHPDRHAANAPNRTEALYIAGCNKCGDSCCIITPFTRNDDKIVFSESSSIQQNAPLNFFNPIRKVWE
jgi:hypothetical protein